jgi:hypothetical protein
VELDSDPHGFWSAGSGFGYRRAKMTHKKIKKGVLWFEVLDILF